MQFKGDNIEDWYRHEMKTVHEQPDPKVWEKLQNDLDVNSIWTRLSHRLDIWYRWLWWRRLAIHTAGIALTATLGYFLVNSWPSDNYSASGVGEVSESLINIKTSRSGRKQALNFGGIDHLQSEAGLSDDQNSSILDSKNEAHSVLIESEHTTQNGQPIRYQRQEWNRGSADNATQLMSSSSETNTLTDKTGKTNPASSDNLMQPVYRELPAMMPLLPIMVKRDERLELWNKRYFLKDAPPVAMQEESKGASHWMVGLVTGVHNQWIISPETGNMIKSKEDRVVTDWGYSAGLSTVYSFNNRYSLETNGYAYATSGIQFMDRRELQEVLRRYHFDFRKLTTLLRIQTSPSNVRPMLNAVVVAGVYTAFLDKAVLTEDGVKTDISEQYTLVDAGITAGYNIDFHMKSRIALSPGIRINQSVINNFKGTDSKPAYFNRTFHTNAEVSLNILYKF